MRSSFVRKLFWAIFNPIRMVDIIIGGVCIIILSCFVLIGPPEGADDLGWYMSLPFMTAPFIALMLNGILNRWEKPPGRAISIILFIIFVIYTALAALMLGFGLLEQDPTVMFSVPFIFLFLINALMALRGVFRKKSLHAHTLNRRDLSVKHFRYSLYDK